MLVSFPFGKGFPNTLLFATFGKAPSVSGSIKFDINPSLLNRPCFKCPELFFQLPLDPRFIVGVQETLAGIVGYGKIAIAAGLHLAVR